MNQSKGKTIPGQEYIALCKFRDKENKFHIKLINDRSPKYGTSILVKRPQKNKKKPGEYQHYCVDDIECIILNMKEDIPIQTRWVPTTVLIKEQGWTNLYLYFEPYFFDIL